eukprot:scaffold3611_cov288-Ochromonas_danica.AAC.1
MGKVGVADGSDEGAGGKSDAVGEIADVAVSNEVPPLSVLSKSTLESIIPLAISGTISYIVLVACYYKVDNFVPYIVHSAALFSSVEIIFVMGAYLIFSTRFANMDRGFRSPFGMLGAVLAIGFWILLFVSILYYLSPNDRMWEGLSLLFFYIVCIVYYVGFASRHQFFSREEQEKFLKAYIVNANKGKKKGRAGGGGAGVGAGKLNSNKSGSASKIWGNLQAAFGLASSSSSRRQASSSNNQVERDLGKQVEIRSPVSMC